MKRLPALLILSTAVGFTWTSHASVLVNDTWTDGTRTDPASPIYSENGTDADSDGDLESAWYNANGTLTASAGHLLGTMPASGTSSASWTTYFTPESSPVTLSGAGDQLKVTWVFTPTGVNANNTSQAFPLAVVDSPVGSRLTGDGSPGTAAYTGYGVFMNMGQTLGNSHPFQLMERTNGSGAFLSSSSPEWIGRADGAVSGNHGYDNGTQYTFIMTVTRNASDELEIVATMTGGTLNGSGVASAAYTDTTPNGNSYSFDTFGLRPNRADRSATNFNTTLFRVEFIPGATAPSLDSNPQDLSVLEGQDASFSVQASGTAPLSYRWYYNTNTLLTADTNSTLTLTNVQLSDAGGYSVIVSNAYGSATSDVATLTVTIPVAPSIVTQPQDQTVLPGGGAQFTVIAGGSEPLNYQWYFNTNTALAGANDSMLTLNDAQVANAGSYLVVVSNTAGSVTSSNAVLTLNTNPVAPAFISQPASQIVLAGSTASFTAAAAGTAPISYQWSRNNSPLPGATSSTLTLTNVQTTAAGSYTLTASNSVGSATSDAAVLTVTTSVSVPWTAYNLAGFGRATTGGGVIPETDPAYRKVYTALDLANAFLSAYKTAGSVKVIEIMNDLDLGWNEVGTAVQTLGSSPFRAHAAPKLHPRLLTTGVSLIDIKPRSGLTIFSANGATIRHACFNIKSAANVIVRNLKFDELWEWDEASKGDYDKNDWDFIDLGNGGTVSNIWIDHCTFTKAYDGITDIKQGSFAITFSWCKYTGDDGATNTNSWVRQQISMLESNKASYAMYNFLRTRGFSTEDIVMIVQGHDKTHLIGATTDAINAQHTVTFHHDWFINPWDRLPRLRAGNVHNFNIYVDDSLGLAAKRLRDARAAAMSAADQFTLNNTYSFKPFLNGSISTEGGAVLVEKSVYIDCLTPLRNNQTDPANPFYTGKILALDTIYQMDSTVVRGNSTNSGNPLGPFQAAIIPFSWNLPGGQLPYTYTMDDPGQLKGIVTSATNGAGAGVLTWNKTNWLVTSYPASAPVMVAQPLSQAVVPGGSASFTVVASGSGPLSYQWYFNTNTALAGATNAGFSLTNVQSTNAGVYFVIVSNTAGPVASSSATLTVNAPANTAPVLPAVADTTLNVGVTLNLTNLATDAEAPPQTLTFSLLAAPTNASLGASSGVFNWRPLVTQAGTTNLVTLKVADSGAPSLSATQSFTVTVNPLASPTVTSPTWTNAQLRLVVTGDPGPDYAVQVSTNLQDWQSVFTNTVPPPFEWVDTDTAAFPLRFYRIVVGPPLP